MKTFTIQDLEAAKERVISKNDATTLDAAMFILSLLGESDLLDAMSRIRRTMVMLYPVDSDVKEMRYSRNKVALDYLNSAQSIMEVDYVVNMERAK